MSEMTDSVLLDRVMDGDRESVSQLYDRHSPVLYGVALRILGDRSAADSAIEELFLSIWDGSSRYDGVYGSPQAWLLRLIRDRALDRQTQNVSPAVPTSERPTPRQLVEAVFFQGTSVATLAKQHGLPEAEIRRDLQAGMVALRKEFAPGAGK